MKDNEFSPADHDYTSIFFDYVRALEENAKAMRLQIIALEEAAESNGGRIGGPPKKPCDHVWHSIIGGGGLFCRECGITKPSPKDEPAPEASPPQQQTPGGKAHGFSGDACSECHAMMLVRNGTCMKCMACGTTTGCS